MASATLTSQQPTSTMTLEQSCPSCGADITNLLRKHAQSTQSRITELEAQVRILTDKATAAVDKLADYEDQLHQLKSTASPSQQNPHLPSTEHHLSPNNPDQQHPSRPQSSDPTNPPQRSPFQTRLSSLLPSSRRSVSPSSAPPTQLTHSQSVRQPPSCPQPLPPTHNNHHHHTTSNPLPSSPDLPALLEQERTLRLAAEASLSRTHTEIEELSATLFSEANELVAVERRALHALRAEYEELQRGYRELEIRTREREKEEGRLRARVGVLEDREGEKGRRWEELERRVGRVEKVRRLLGEEGGGRRVVSAGAVEGVDGRVDGSG